LRSAVCAPLHGYAIRPGTVVHRLARVEPRGGSISLGRNCALHEFACVYGNGGAIVIGDHVSLHPFSILYGDGGIRIGSDVLVSAHVVVVSDNLRYAAGQLIARQGRDREGIVIEDDVWIGAHAVILDGVTIARGCVIGAGAVVTKSTEPYGVYLGAPAARTAERQ
jgi:acetyltransferase-like isoleucine patch superfamily enzyme